MHAPIRGLTLAFAVLLQAAAPAAADDCSKEVADAFAKQRQASALRLDTWMINERGPLVMRVDYQLPDRMYQIVRAVIDPAPTETILVGKRGWVSKGEGWKELPAEDAMSLAEEMEKQVVKGPAEAPAFECIGMAELKEKKLKAYQALPDKTAPPEQPIRIVYVDPVTGLPARSILAQKDKLDRPFFRQDFSYPQDIVIAPPLGTNAPAQGADAPPKNPHASVRGAAPAVTNPHAPVKDADAPNSAQSPPKDAAAPPHSAKP